MIDLIPEFAAFRKFWNCKQAYIVGDINVESCGFMWGLANGVRESALSCKRIVLVAVLNKAVPRVGTSYRSEARWVNTCDNFQQQNIYNLFHYHQALCLIFDRQWLWITFLSLEALLFLEQRFQRTDSKYSWTTRCWQYHNSRGGVREMSLRTKKILPGVRKGNFVTWSADCRSYFFSSRKPANVNVQKHAKRARVCIFKYKCKTQSSEKKLKSEAK